MAQQTVSYQFNLIWFPEIIPGSGSFANKSLAKYIIYSYKVIVNS